VSGKGGLLRRELAMAEATSTVIDDDPAIRESIGSLVRSVGLQAKLLASVDEFLKAGRPGGPTCLVLDVRLPRRSGLDFQRELVAVNLHIPIIFISGHADVPMSVRAMKGGEIEFLTKPVRDQDLLDAIQLAIAQDRPPRELGREANLVERFRLRQRTRFWNGTGLGGCWSLGLIRRSRGLRLGRRARLPQTGARRRDRYRHRKRDPPPFMLCEHLSGPLVKRKSPTHSSTNPRIADWLGFLRAL